MSLFIDIHQYGKIEQAQTDAADAKRNTTGLEQRIADLERRADRLALACQAMWETLKESTHIPEEAIYARMQQIDLRDGKADGKIGGQVLQCTNCGRSINSKSPACIYCGQRNQSKIIVD